MKTVAQNDAAGAAVSGRLVAAFPEAVEQTCGSFDHTMCQLMSESSVERIDYHGWYDRRELLETCSELRDTVGDQIVERIGRFLPELLDWRGDVSTVADGLRSLDDWYDDLHRGHDDSVQFRVVNDHHVQLSFDTPYPGLFERGLVRGIGHRFRSGSVQGLVVDSDTTSEGWSRVVVL